MARSATRAARRVLFVSGFMVVLFMGAAEPLIRLVLERGAFTSQDTLDTAGTLFFYAPGILFISFNMLLKVLLFVRRHVGPILIAGILELVLNVALNAALVGPMGTRGLALATSVTTLVVTIALPVHLARQGLLAPREVLSSAVRLLPAMAGAFFVVWMISGTLAGRSPIETALGLGLAALAGAAAYVAIAHVAGLRVRDLGAFSLRKG